MLVAAMPPLHSDSGACRLAAAPCRSPWPPLDALRGKVLVVLILGRATSTEAKGFYAAFPGLSEWLAVCVEGWVGLGGGGGGSACRRD